MRTIGDVGRSSASPLEGVDRLVVDGSNLLHALARGTALLPRTALIGRIRAAIPPAVSIELVFDGPPEPGMGSVRVASGLVVRFAGRRSADEAILALVDEASNVSRDAQGADNVLVVTDDRDLRHAVGGRGAATARLAWLLGRLARTVPAAPTTGAGRPVARREPDRPADDGDEQEGESERPRWQAGRGATRKRGNPRRAGRRR
jgi:hypothetical protein